MRTPARSLPALAALALAAPLAACATGRPHVAPAASDAGAGVRLVVRDENRADVDLYAVEVGLRSRIGSVTAGDSTVVDVAPSLVADGALRVIAVPIGGVGRASTGPVLVQPGQTVIFTVMPDLAASAVSVR